MSGQGVQWEQRVLILPPTRKDGQVTCALLEQAGLDCLCCADPAELAREVLRGAGAVLLTEKFILTPGGEAVLAALEQQPAWSDLPVVMLMQGGTPSARATGVLAALIGLRARHFPWQALAALTPTPAAAPAPDIKLSHAAASSPVKETGARQT